MKKIIKLLNQHIGHTIDCVETPSKLHYAKLCCRDCGNHRGTRFLAWVGPRDMVAMGYWTDEQAKQKQQLKLAHKKKHRKQIDKQANKPTKWAQATIQERNFYTNYQPRSFSLPRTPSQLIGDRLALTGISKYNGNSIHSIPTIYLKSLLISNKITNKQDRQLIQASLDLRTGSYTGSPESIKSKA